MVRSLDERVTHRASVEHEEDCAQEYTTERVILFQAVPVRDFGGIVDSYHVGYDLPYFSGLRATFPSSIFMCGGDGFLYRPS